MPVTSQPLLLNVTQVAAMMGVSDRTIWRRIREGALPAVRLGGRVLVKREDLEAFVDRLEGR